MTCMRDGFVEGLVLDGRFESISPLNHGSFGMVFLAKDLTSGDNVAIKCIGKTPTNDTSLATWATDHQLELACHERLGYHPNIVNIIHAFETNAHMYLVLEFCSMGDLYEAIRLGRGPLETEHVRGFMLQLVDAVEHMHSKGLYHRDIKPENIFLTQDGSVKLGDFGLSTTDTWTYESSVGSDRYMAPEQYDPADTGYDPAQADIWAIGICLLNILFSRNPFVTPSESDVVFADYVLDKESLFDFFPLMSPDTFEVLIHALCIEPKKRSLSAVRNALVAVSSFTTVDEVYDEFCTEDRELVPASANRQPLRTPSIASPPVEKNEAYPWSRILHMSPPQSERQLSAIPDTELSHEDLFDDVAYSGPTEKTSLASVLDSAFNDSVKSMTLREPRSKNPPKAEAHPMSGSLPISVSKPVPAMSSIFGIKETVSKSWSEIYEEDEEETEEPVDPRRQFNGMNWSTESVDQDVTIRQTFPIGVIGTSIETNVPTPSLTNTEFSEGRRSEDASSLESLPRPTYKLPSYSPPAKRSTFDKLDKWAALGQRRRSVNPPSDPEVEGAKEVNEVKEEGSRESAIFGLRSWRQGLGNGFGTGFSWMTPTRGNGRNRGDRRSRGDRKDRGEGQNRGDGWRSRFPAFGWEQKEKEKDKPTSPSNEDVKVMDWHNDMHLYPHLRHDTGFESSVLSDVDEKSQEGDGDAEWVGGWPSLHL